MVEVGILRDSNNMFWVFEVLSIKDVMESE